MDPLAVEDPGSPVLGYIFMLAVSVAFIATLWKLFQKAGRPGWFSLIPLYNLIVLCEIAGKPVWWAAMLICPVVNILFLVLLSFALAKRFGQGAGFGMGLFLMGPVFYPLLAFGGSNYEGETPKYGLAR
jgi:hypothetical protein